MGRLSGKVALVTGAGSVGPGWGNGRATAALFAWEGANVLACDVDEQAVLETKRLIEAEGGICEASVGDVASDSDVTCMVERCIQQYGRLDVLHNNVGVYRLGGPTDLPEAEWDLVLATNLRSLFLTCRRAIPVMLEQGGGAIVNIGSISGIRYMGLPQIAYATSKAAVVAFTRSIAAQYGANGIRANCVIPGIIDTPVLALASERAYAEQFGASSIANLRTARADTVPLGRLGSAWDVARASLFLASDEAQYVTGAELLVDGGLSTVLPQPPRPKQHN